MRLLKRLYGKLVAKLNNIDTSKFVIKTKYNEDKTEIGKKIPHTTDLVKKTDYNSKSSELEEKKNKF